MNEEEKKAVEHLKETSKDRIIIPVDDEILIAVYLIEKLQKENEELEEINNELEAEKNEAIRRYNFETISIQKVKDKIEELNKAYEDSKDENGESEYYYPDYTIRVLEELLESE